MGTVSEYFGRLVFDDRVMKANLSAKVYQSLKKTIAEGVKLDISVANAVGDRYEGLGDRQRCNSLHPLVPASDRCHCRETRQLYFSGTGRKDHYGILRKRANQRRTGRFLISFRRHRLGRVENLYQQNLIRMETIPSGFLYTKILRHEDGGKCRNMRLNIQF